MTWMTLNHKNIWFCVFLAKFCGCGACIFQEWIATKWVKIKQDNLQTGTARLSHVSQALLKLLVVLLLPSSVNKFDTWTPSLRQTKDIRLSYSETAKFLSHLRLNQYLVVTDRRTDRNTDTITIANTRCSIYMLSRVKKLQKWTPFKTRRLSHMSSQIN